MSLLALLLAAQAPYIAFPEPGLDDPAAYEGYATRLYRDSRGNAVQIYLDAKSGRVVHLWADALNESVGFTARDAAGRPAALAWRGTGATAGTAGRRRTLTYRLTAPGALRLSHFLLGSMRWERDFQYAGRHRDTLNAPFIPDELAEMLANLARLPPPGRRRALALLGAPPPSIAALRARLEPGITIEQTATTWVVRIEQTSFDGKHHLTLNLRGDARRADVAGGGGRDGLIIRPRDARPIEVAVEIATDGPALTPLPRAAIFNDAFLRFVDSARSPRLEREVRGFELLSSREKLMAGLPNFATYFGRDMLMTALLMEPVWSDTMAEFVIAAALAKLAPTGEVSHEEALGGQAIRENAAEYNRTRNPAILARLGAVRENYMMVDDDFQLPVVAARYFADAAVPAARKRAFFARWREPLLRNLAFVARQAAPYAKDPAATNLVSFRRLEDGWWHAGSWRDSRVGYAGGRFAMDVNAVWVPAALRAIGTIDSTLRALGLAGVPGARNVPGWVTVWRGAVRHFEVALAPAEVETRVRAKLASLPGAERAYWERGLARTGFPTDSLRFLALSLDSAGRPIPVMSTDPAMLLLLEDLSPERVAELLRPFTLAYPVGLLVEGLGPLAANDAYAPPAVWAMFERDLYHSPRVVWGREVNVLLAARPDVAPVRAAVERSGLRHAELWSYRIEGDSLRPVRYGTSSDVQLWNLTDLAVQFLLSRLPER
jgi:hypothetical protein